MTDVKPITDAPMKGALTDRLRGKYPIGPRLTNGEPEFGWRQYEAPSIQHEAAAEIEKLQARLQQLEEALRRCDNAIQAWWPPATIVSQEGFAVIEAGRLAHEMLLVGEKK